MIIKLKNDFHRTEARLRVDGLPAELSPGQVRRCGRVLCGMEDCCCSADPGIRGPQDYDVDARQYDDGSWSIRINWKHSEG